MRVGLSVGLRPELFLADGLRAEDLRAGMAGHSRVGMGAIGPDIAAGFASEAIVPHLPVLQQVDRAKNGGRRAQNCCALRPRPQEFANSFPALFRKTWAWFLCQRAACSPEPRTIRKTLLGRQAGAAGARGRC